MAEKKRINNVTSGLQVETELEGSFRSCGLEERMRYYQAPGIGITIVDGGRISWSGGFGYRNARAREKVGSETIFLTGSISKPVFSLAVIKLVESGLIDLDRDVNEYLKRWKVPCRGGWQPKVTLRQLLSHTAGTTVHGFPGYKRSAPVPGIVEILKGLPPSNTDPVMVNIIPGTTMRYSGGGVTVAQLAIEDAVGVPFTRLVEDVLFRPLNLKDSSFDQAFPSKRRNEIAHGYPYHGEELRGGYHIYPEMAAAGLWSTGRDLAVLMIEVQKALAGKSSFFGKKSIVSMLTPQKIAKNMGLGFFIEGEGSAQRFYHGGWDEGFVAKFVFYKHGGKGAVLLLNSNSGAPMINEVLRSIAVEYGWADYIQSRPKPVRSFSKGLEKFCGAYRSETGLLFDVKIAGAGLELRLEGQPPLKILPESERSFFSPDLNLKVKFEANRSGRISSLSVIQASSSVKAEKRLR